MPRRRIRWDSISSKAAGWVPFSVAVPPQRRQQVSYYFDVYPKSVSDIRIYSSGSSRGNENLVQAFVQFLEQESQPQAQSRPTLLSMTGQMDGVTSASATTSTAATSGHLPQASSSFSPATPAASQQDPAAPRTPPVGGSPQLLAMGSNEFAPTRNSSSILKDILSDS